MIFIYILYIGRDVFPTCQQQPGNYVGYLEARDAAFARQWKRYYLHRDNVKRLKRRISRLEERFILDTLAKKKKDYPPIPSL